MKHIVYKTYNPTTGELLRKWDSICEAQQTLGIHHISAAANGKRKSAGGFVWKIASSNKAFCGTQKTTTTSMIKIEKKFNTEPVSATQGPNTTAYVV